ncbi:hypothetical protein FB45DRAFT_1022343 [Roridomyces roridus]|uniref:Uncharacterized protein n=1 Tax=Roridomyces roridus TaxID=1738132 RepID=A0AAD7FVM6_9AGAR|nr:hypothetical protein FB45DRAFT_1022343 [Roridomyces roridus]
MSPAYQKFLKGLTAQHDGSGFREFAKAENKIIKEPRGSPENTGSHLTAVQCVDAQEGLPGFVGKM